MVSYLIAHGMLPDAQFVSRDLPEWRERSHMVLQDNMAMLPV